jgi:hypothetical protein
LDKLYEEVGYVAYHFHWSKDEIEDLAHPERHRWVKVISEINQKINETQGGGGVGPMSRIPQGPPQRPGSSRLSGGKTLVNDIEAVRKALAERARREKEEQEQS